jgi:ubiquinone/menaquinone biosynthesis C-methylase UbiE
MSLIQDEQEKYNIIHDTKKGYGWETVRFKWFDESPHKFFKKLFKYFSISKTALDIGCGKGSFYNYFKNRFPHIDITGIDISKIAIESCKEKGFNCIESSADSLPFKDNSFDIVYHLDGYEHIPVEIEVKVLEEQVRVAKKFIVHQIARGQSVEDEYLISIGKTPLHINLKTDEEWLMFFNKHAERLGYNILVNYDIKEHTSIILRKI